MKLMVGSILIFMMSFAWTSQIAPSPTQAMAAIILYEEALDEQGLLSLVALKAERYFVVYQNNADPDAQKSGIIDPAKVARYVASTWGDCPEGWGVLDFEDPFDARLQGGIGTEECKNTISTMVEAVRTLKRIFPKVKWTYYGIPGLAFYLAGETWDIAPESARNAELQHQRDAHRAILAECDWIAPCIYNTVGEGHAAKIAPDRLRKATRAWVAARVALSRSISGNQPNSPPVVPFGSPLYLAGGGARSFSVIPKEVLLQDTIEPALNAGAHGICIWSGAQNYIAIATGDRPATGFTEGGGKSVLVNTWSDDLGIDPTALASPDGRKKLITMISKAQIDMAKGIRSKVNATFKGDIPH
ncbi:MAG: hypothetical protein RIR77_2041 [Planctomycetota bacterium]|jgi:hypothetical protein